MHYAEVIANNHLLDPGLKPLESDTLKAAAPQNVNDRTYTTACNPANSSKITVPEKDRPSQNQPTRFPIILFNPWITVTLSLGCQVFEHFLTYVITYFILAGVSLLEYQPFSLLFFPQKSLILSLLHLYPTIPCDKMFKQIDQVFWYSSYFNFSGFLCVRVDSAEFSPSRRIPARQ